MILAPSFTYFNLNPVKGKFDLNRINDKLKEKHPSKEGDGVFPGQKRWTASDAYAEPSDEFSEPKLSSLEDNYIAVVAAANEL